MQKLLKRLSLMIIIVPIAGWTLFDSREIYKEFVGGRTFYSYNKLTLFDNHEYAYSSHLFHGGLRTEDKGNWTLQDSILVLKSSESAKTRWVPSSKKYKKKTGKNHMLKTDSTLHFRNERFVYSDEKIFLFNWKKLKNEEDSSYFLTYHVLYEQPGKQD